MTEVVQTAAWDFGRIFVPQSSSFIIRSISALCVRASNTSLITQDLALTFVVLQIGIHWHDFYFTALLLPHHRYIFVGMETPLESERNPTQSDDVDARHNQTRHFLQFFGKCHEAKHSGVT